MLSTPFLLLVVALCCSTAQTRNLLPSSRNNNKTEALVTSSGTAATAVTEADAGAHLVVDGKTLQAVKQNLLDLEQASAVAVRQSSSVVQDWSLVCKELCGAGLSGTACADVCLDVDKALPRPHNVANMKRLLHANKPFVCKDLCRLRLGNAACACAATAAHVLGDADRNQICRSFCEHGGLTLNGCSACKTATRSEEGGKEDEDEDGIDGASKVPNITISTTTTTTVSKNTKKKEKQQQETAHGSMPSLNSSSVGSNIAVDVDVAVNIVGIKPAADVETTTPDWDEMCKILCKTGDGGSLCNCDLSPFFTI